MSEESRLLDLIEDGVSEHGGDLGGRDVDTLQLFDGRVTLRELHELVDQKEGGQRRPWWKFW